jgi:hypothetical protein
LLLVALTTVAAASATTITAAAPLPLPLPPPPLLEGEGVERQEEDVQEEAVEVTSTDDETSLCAVPRPNSLTRSMLVADLKVGSGDVLEMMSTVLVKWESKPRRRFSTSSAGETVWPTSRRASAVRFICWA